MRHMRQAVAIAAAMSLLVVGCSDDSDEESVDTQATSDAVAEDDSDESGGTPASNEAELTFEEWQVATIAVCEEYEAGGEELIEDEPTSATDALESLERVAGFAADYSAALQAVGVPAERSDEVAQFHETRATIAELLAQLRDAAESDNESEFVAVSEQLQQVTGEVGEDAIDLGVPACG